MTPDELKVAAERIGPLIGVLTGVLMLFKQIREPLYRRLWLPIRSRISTKGDIIRKQEEREQASQRRHEEVMAELKPQGQLSLSQRMTNLEIATEITAATLRQHLDGQDIGIFHADEHGETVWVNNAYLRMTGRQLNDVLGYGWMACIAESDRAFVRAEWNNCVMEGREFLLNYRMVDANGGLFTVECVARPGAKMAGRILRWQGEVTPENSPAPPNPRR